MHRDDDPPLGVADVEEGAVDRGAVRDEVLVLLAARGIRERLALLVDTRGRRGDVARHTIVRVAAAGHRQTRLAVVALPSDTGRRAGTRADCRTSTGSARAASASARECRGVRRTAVATVVAPARGGLGLPLLGSSGERRRRLCGHPSAVRLDVEAGRRHRLGLGGRGRDALSADVGGKGLEVELLLDGDQVAPEEVLVAGSGLGCRANHQPRAVGAGVDRLAVVLVEGVGGVGADAGPLLVVVPVEGPQPEARAHQTARELERRGRRERVNTCKTRTGAGVGNHLLLTIRVGLRQQGEPAERDLGTRALDRCHLGCRDSHFEFDGGRYAGGVIAVY